MEWLKRWGCAGVRVFIDEEVPPLVGDEIPFYARAGASDVRDMGGPWSGFAALVAVARARSILVVEAWQADRVELAVARNVDITRQARRAGRFVESLRDLWDSGDLVARFTVAALVGPGQAQRNVPNIILRETGGKEFAHWATYRLPASETIRTLAWARRNLPACEELFESVTLEDVYARIGNR